MMHAQSNMAVETPSFRADSPNDKPCIGHVSRHVGLSNSFAKQELALSSTRTFQTVLGDVLLQAISTSRFQRRWKTMDYEHSFRLQAAAEHMILQEHV